MGMLDDDSSCVPYSRRPEWADVAPLPPPLGDAGKVVAIQYSERHAEALGYFRAIRAQVGGAGCVRVHVCVGRGGKCVCTVCSPNG
jgi:hypothetical protein